MTCRRLGLQWQVLANRLVVVGDDLASQTAIQVEQDRCSQVRGELSHVTAHRRQHEYVGTRLHAERREISPRHVDPIVVKKYSRADQCNGSIATRCTLQPRHRWVLRIGDQRPLAKCFHPDESVWKQKQLVGIESQRSEALSIDTHFSHVPKKDAGPERTFPLQVALGPPIGFEGRLLMEKTLAQSLPIF